MYYKTVVYLSLLVQGAVVSTEGTLFTAWLPSTSVPVTTPSFNCSGFTNRRIFDILIIENGRIGGNKEGLSGIVKCNIKSDCYEHDDAANARARKILKNVTVSTNGKELSILSRAQNGNGAYTFTFIWHYRHHHAKEFWCVSEVDNYTYTSHKRRVYVQENVTITVSTNREVVTAGSNYSVTCTASSVSGIKGITWSRRSLTLVEDEQREVDCKRSMHYKCENKVVGNTATLMMATTKKDAGQKWEYFCGSGHAFIPNKAIHPVTIEIKAKSKVAIIIPSVILILIVIGVGVTVGIVCYRRKILEDNTRYRVLQAS